MRRRRRSILLCGLLVLLCACGNDTTGNTEPTAGNGSGITAAGGEEGFPADYERLADGQNFPPEGNWETGRYLRGKQSDLIITGDRDVMTMRAADETVSFADFENGDVIRVYIGCVLETWPGQTTVYAVERAEDEGIADISPELTEELREMGWLE